MYKVLLEQTALKILFERSGRVWGDNFKMDMKNQSVIMDWIHMA
jgi:hypothetical protein